MIRLLAQWKPEGCYKQKKKALVKTFATIKVSNRKGYPQTFFDIAKALAEKEGYDVFGIGTKKSTKKVIYRQFYLRFQRSSGVQPFI